VIAGPVSEAAEVPVRGYRLGDAGFEEVLLTVVD
jgi:hypothetical protein